MSFSITQHLHHPASNDHTRIIVIVLFRKDGYLYTWPECEYLSEPHGEMGVCDLTVTQSSSDCSNKYVRFWTEIVEN